MNAKHVALLAFLGLAGSTGALSAQPPNAPDQAGGVDISFFYDQLSPYGSWVESRSYGWVWLPSGVGADWRPYQAGHWVMTDYGWTWLSDEPFGWAAYHYGRWVNDPDYGWEWVPGYEWGPAWVAWRTGGGYIGWAPLPPEVRFRAGIGLDFGGVDLDVALGPTRFCFVQERSFLRPNVATYVEGPARNVTIINNTTNITKYTVVNNRVVNQGIPVQRAEQVTGQRVQRLQIAAVKSGAPPRSAQVRGSQLTVFQPPIVKRSTPPPPPPQRARASGADLQRRQAQQAQERSQVPQTNQRQPAAQERKPQQQQQQQRSQQPAAEQRQATPHRAPAGNSQDLARQHQAESQAQQQPQRKQQQGAQPQGKPQGQPEGKQQGQAQGRPQGQAQRQEQGQPQGKAQGQPQGKQQGQERKGEQPQNKKPEKPEKPKNPPPPPPPGRR